MSGAAQPVEVNGKVWLGTRRLVISHVENAASFFAYQEAEADFMKQIAEACKKHCDETLPKEALKKEQTSQAVAVYSASEKAWYRGKVELLNQGPDKKQVKVRSLDFGWNRLFDADSVHQMPAALNPTDLPVLCEKYKMTDIKPRGRFEGYSAADRQAGAEWLTRFINARVVVATCYQQVRYGGGILADCMVGDKNMNRAAVQKGHAIPCAEAARPAKRLPNRPPFLARNSPGGRVIAGFPIGITNGANGDSDLDYAAYNGKAAGGSGPKRPGKVAGIRATEGNLVGPKSEEVKKLERIINENKNTINQLRKSINLDAHIKELVQLLEKAKTSRNKSGDQLGSPAIPAGVAQVIEESSKLSSNLMTGLGEVEAATKKLADSQGEAHSEAGRIQLQRCMQEYLDKFTEEQIEEDLSRVKSQLIIMSPHIAPNLKLLTVPLHSVSRHHLLEVAANVRKWQEVAAASDSQPETVLYRVPEEVESLVRDLTQLAESIRARSQVGEGVVVPAVPTGLDARMEQARHALQAQLATGGGGGGGVANGANQKKGEGVTETGVRRSTWRALTALKGQLELGQKKRREFEALLLGGV